MILKRIRRIMALPLYDKMNLVEMWFYELKGIIFYRRVFKSFGKRSLMYPPMLIGGPVYIEIGDKVMIRKGVRIEAVLVDPTNPPEIRIGDSVNIEQDVHIVAIGKIHIHDNVTIAARSSILGGTHSFLDVHSPIKICDRLDGAESLTEIGNGSFLGNGCVIQMNVKLGRGVVVGANSVVKKDVSDYCVVEGHPAVVVLRYDATEDRWTRTPKKD